MGYKYDWVESEGAPMHLIIPFLIDLKVHVFIETGTAGGDTIKKLAPHFKECHTIEIIPGRAIVDEALTNVTWHTGHTVDVLKTLIDHYLQQKEGLLAEDYRYIIFWLDAHYSDGTPNTTGHKECYILEELEEISRYREDAIIFIDDARLFMGPPPYPLDPQQWPYIQDIFVKLKELFPYAYTTLVDDYIVCIPGRLKGIIDAEWTLLLKARYPSKEEKMKREMRNVFIEAVKQFEVFKKYLNV